MIAFAFASLSIFPSAALALPTGYTVESGDVSFDTSQAGHLVITASDRAIINFDSFSIGAGESVRFLQPFETSSVLSRVTGSLQSDIYGGLYANGQLVLVNPNGITFHPGSDVQAHSLVASTLDIQSALYASGQWTFEKREGSGVGRILNDASIRVADGGHIAFLAERIENRGYLTAHLGTVALGVGEKQTLTFDGAGLVGLVIDRGLSTRLEAGRAGLENEGAITADGGRVVLTASTLEASLESIVNNTGVVKAAAAVEKDGEVVFVSNNGVDSTGDVTATNVTIEEGTTLNAASGTFVVEKDWTNKGTFNGSGSTVNFTSPFVSRVSGDNTFGNFTATVADKRIEFEKDKTQTIAGDWTTRGEYGRHVRLVSSEAGSRWKVNPLGARNLSYTWVEDSENIHADRIVMTESTNRGNSVNWDPVGTWAAAAPGGLWSNAANWSGLGGATPGAGDDVVFNTTANFSSIVDAGFTGSIGSFTVNPGYTQTITLQRSLTVTNGGGLSGDATLNDGILVLNGNAFSVTNDLTVGSLATIRAIGQAGENVTFGTSSFSGTYEYVGDNDGVMDSFSVANFGANDYFHLVINATDNLDVFLAGGSLNVDGNMTVSRGEFNTNGQAHTVAGALTLAGGTYQVAGPGIQTFGDLNVSGGTMNGGGNTTDIVDDMTMSAGTFNASTGTTQVGGDWIVTGGTFNHNGGALDLDGAASQSFNPGGFAFDNVTHSGAGAVTLAGALSIGMALNNNAGVFSLNGNNISVGAAFSNAGTFQLRGSETVTLTPGNDVAQGTWRYVGDGDSVADTYTILDFDPGIAGDYFNLEIAATDLLDVFQLTATPMDTNNNLTVTSGVFSLNSNSVTVDGAMTNAATVRLQGSESVSITGTRTENGTWEYVGEADGLPDAFTILDFGANDYFNLRVAATDTTFDTFQSGAAKTVAGTLTVAGGTYSANGFTTNVTGDVNVSAASSTYNSSTAAQTMGGLTISMPGAIFNGNSAAVDVNGDVSVTGGTLNAPGGLMTVSGDWINSGGMFNHNGGTVRFDGSGGTQLVNAGGTFNSFQVQTTLGGVVELLVNTNAMTNFTVTSGVLSLDGFNLATAGAITNNATIQLHGNETVTGARTENGTWRYVGDSDGLADTFTVQDFGAADDYNNLTIAGVDAGDVFVLASDVDINATLTVSGGTFSLNGFDVNAVGLINSATIRLHGDEAFTLLGSPTETGTWEYVGDGDGLADTYDIKDFGITDYFNLTIDGTDAGDTFRAMNGLAAAGDLTNASGTFNANGNTVDVTGSLFITGGSYVAPAAGLAFTVGGDFARTGGTFTHNSGTLELDGNAQTITGSTTFNNLSKSTPGGTLTFGAGSTQTVAGTLTLAGASGNLLTLESDNPGTQWNINPQGGLAVSFVSVQDSNNLNGTVINPPNSTNVSNNTNWFTGGGGGGGGGGVGGGGGKGGGTEGDVNGANNNGGTTGGSTFGGGEEGDDEESGAEEGGSNPQRAGGGPRAGGDKKFGDIFGGGSDRDDEEEDDLEEEEGGSSYVGVEEGAVYVHAVGGGEGQMIYDGESLTMGKDGKPKVGLRAVYVTTVDGIKVFRAKVHTPLKEMKWKEPPTGLAASKKGKKVYAIAQKAGKLRVIDTTSFESRNVGGVAESSVSVTLSPDEKKVYVCDSLRDTIQVIDVKSEKILKTFQAGSMPSQVAVTADGASLYVLNRLDKTVTLLDADTGEERLSVPAGESPYGIALSADESTLYVSDTGRDRVVVMDATGRGETGSISVGDAPTAIKLDNDGRRLFVSNRGENTISVIDVASKREISRISVGRMPTDIALVPEGDRAYVSNALSGSVSVVNVPKGEVIETIRAGVGPTHVILSTPPRPVKDMPASFAEEAARRRALLAAKPGDDTMKLAAAPRDSAEA